MSGKTLRGWKEISTHLRVSERTAMRWARSLALPVCRTAGTPGSSVHADAAALDEWLARAGTRVAPPAIDAPADAPGHPPVLTEDRGGGRFLPLAVSAVFASAAMGLVALVFLQGDAPVENGKPAAVVLVAEVGGVPVRMRQTLGSTAVLRLSPEIALGLTPVALVRDRGEDPHLTLSVSRIDGGEQGSASRSSSEIRLLRAVATEIAVDGRRVRLTWEARRRLPRRQE